MNETPMRVPSILHVAWRVPDGSLGFVFINLQRAESQTLPIELDPARYGIRADAAYQVRRVTESSNENVSTHTGPLAVPLPLKPRCFVVLEVTARPEGQYDA